MLFSSLIFLYLFLPIVLAGYYVLPYKLKNYWLLLASLIFFAWGGVSNTLILIISIIVNFFLGKAVAYNPAAMSKGWLVTGVSINILLLVVFKYANFLTTNINSLWVAFSFEPLPNPGIVLPVGISFYTFHLISYLVDIYKGKSKAQANIFDLSLYVAMFSQLIAGPIIRYSDVWLQLKERKHNMFLLSSGVELFLIGLAKKVLLANVLAKVADQIFHTNPSDLVAANAWLGLICYTLQIYCDFSGYSDMAVGLGRMFGFEFMENFNFPYMAQSVKEFWRRWHISLSSFFRDYVYIPLGGNKTNKLRMYINLCFVFLITGLWHGASWTFIVWGLMHGFFMIIERLGFEKTLAKTARPIRNIYTLLVVMLAWVMFRSETFEFALKFWRALFKFQLEPDHESTFLNYVDTELCLVFAIAVAGSFGLFSVANRYLQQLLQRQSPIYKCIRFAYDTLSVCVYAAILILSSMYLVAGTYNPFIYYQF